MTNASSLSYPPASITDFLLFTNVSSDEIIDMETEVPVAASSTTSTTTTTAKSTTIRQPIFRGSRFGTPQSQADALWKNDRRTNYDNWQETYGQPHEAFFYVELVCNIWFIIELTVRFVVRIQHARTHAPSVYV